MTKYLPAILAAAAGGAAVYWWIKRTCPCAHASSSTAATNAPAAVAVGEVTASTASRGTGDLFADGNAAAANEAIGGELFPGSSSGAQSDCFSCGGGL